MECPICGYPLGENDAFCRNCGNFSLPLQNNTHDMPVIPRPPSTPEGGSSLVDPPEELLEDVPETPPKKVAQRLYPPPEIELEEGTPFSSEEVNSRPVPEHPVRKPGKRRASVSEEKAKKSVRRMAVVTAIACVLAAAAIAAAVYVLVTTSTLRVQLNKAQKENSSAQATAAELETQVAELTDSLDTATAENESLGQQVAELQAQLNNMETSVNQNEYDKDSALRQLEEANTQLDTANQENASLQQQLSAVQSDLENTQSELLDAQAENESLSEENDSLTQQVEDYQEEIDFYDSYVVFVMTNSTDRYYHKYSCPNFSRTSFLAYSTRLAESNGYRACPVCSGGTYDTEENDTNTGLFGGLFG